MNNRVKYAMKLHWNEVANIIGGIVSTLLGREVICTARYEDYNYWCAATTEDDTFTVEELNILLNFIAADASVRYDNIPHDAGTSRSIAMNLSETLLSLCLETTWEHASICRDGLWLVGIEDVSALSKCISKRGVGNVTT